MTLLDLCEPLFQYICTLSREARGGGRRGFNDVRADVKRLLDELKQKAGSNVQLAAQAAKIEKPLIFFVDSMIAQSTLSYAMQWNQNRIAAKEHNELAGDDKFFVLLDETLRDHSEAASERLSVFYVCIWLGFTGPYDRNPEKLRGYCDEIRPRIGHLVDRDPAARLSDDAYKLVDARILYTPARDRIIFMVVLFVFLSLSVLVVYCGMYYKASNVLRDAITTITKKSGAK